MEFAMFFLGWTAGMFACWLLWDARERLKRRRSDDRAWLRGKGVRQDAYAGLQAMSTQLQQAAARLSKPHVGPPPVQRPAAPNPWPPAEPAPWPHGNFFDHVAEPPADPKGF